MVTKTLAQKLYIRPGYTVALLNAPKGAAELLAPLPEEVKVVTTKKSEGDLILCFVKSSAEIEKYAKEVNETLDQETPGKAKDKVIWFAYPKLSSKVQTDLTRDQGWSALYSLGFEGVASVAIDNVWSALRFKRRYANSEKEIIAKQYAGERATFLPIHDRLSSILLGLGGDVTASTRQTYVAFSRAKQFALIKPASDRVDLVLKLPTAPFGTRAIAAANLGSGSMTHRVPITTLNDIDQEVLAWIKDAYRSVNK